MAEMKRLGEVPVTRYPTRLHVQCQICGHQGQVKVFLDQAPRLVCRECGNRDPVVAGRDTMRQMSSKTKRSAARGDRLVPSWMTGRRSG